MTSTQHPITLVTGGSRGLGRNAALALAARGHDIVLTYRGSEAAAHEVVVAIEALGRRAVALSLDVGDSASFPAFAARVKQVLAATWQRTAFDHLVNNAGIGIHAAFADTTEAQFDELMRIQLKGPFFLTQALLPLIADGGAILNVSTGLARFTLPGFAAYAAMKGHRGADALPGEGTGRPRHPREHARSRRHRDRLRRRRGARQRADERGHRRADGPRPRGPAG